MIIMQMLFLKQVSVHLESVPFYTCEIKDKQILFGGEVFGSSLPPAPASSVDGHFTCPCLSLLICKVVSYFTMLISKVDFNLILKCA